MPDCMDGHTCNFDVQQRMQCPFWVSGTYRTTEPEASAGTLSALMTVDEPQHYCMVAAFVKASSKDTSAIGAESSCHAIVVLHV